MFPFIYRLWFRAYPYCLEIRQDRGVKSLEHFLQRRALCSIFFFFFLTPSPAARLVLQRPPGHRHNKSTFTRRWTLPPFSGCSSSVLPNTGGKKTKKQKTTKTTNPINGIHTARTHGTGPALCVTSLLGKRDEKQVQSGANRLTIRQAQGRAAPHAHTHTHTHTHTQK